MKKFEKIETKNLPLAWDLYRQPVGFIGNAFNVRVKYSLEVAEELTFDILKDDPVRDFEVENDMLIDVDEKRFLVTNVKETVNEKVLSVRGEPFYLQLANNRIDVSFKEGTLDEILNAIFGETDWTVENEFVTEDVFEIEIERKSSLYCFYKLGELVNFEFEFDSFNKVVKVLNRVGVDQPIKFDIGKNIESVEKEYLPVEATHFIILGKNDSTIEQANLGENFVENYSYYISRGMTVEEARERFKKVVEIKNDATEDPVLLKQWGIRQAKKYSKPRLSYKSSVVDLLDGYEDEIELSLGDSVVLELGEELIKQRIVELERFLDKEQSDKVTLNDVVKGLAKALKDKVGDGGSGNGDGLIKVRTSDPLIDESTKVGENWLVIPDSV